MTHSRQAPAADDRISSPAPNAAASRPGRHAPHTATAGSATGSTGLAPDNDAHTLTLNAGVSLRLHARLAGT